MMKKLYSFFFAVFMAVTLSAQLATEVVSPGVFKITYGASNDYSLYDPGFGTQTFYIHCWINASQNSTATAFTDDWNNSNVTMNYDPAVGAYVGTIDLNTKLFTNTNNIVPGGTTVDRVGMVFKDLKVGATKQSADVSANGPTTIPVLSVGVATAASQKALVANGQLYTSQKGNLSLKIFDLGGNLIKTMKVSANGAAIDLNLPKKGLYLLKVAGTKDEVVKFSY